MTTSAAERKIKVVSWLFITCIIAATSNLWLLLVDHWEQFIIRHNVWCVLSPTHTLKTYVLINCKLGGEDKITNELGNVPGAVGAYGVYGLYDIVAEVRSDTPEDLKEIASRVRRIENIISPNTLIEVERIWHPLCPKWWNVPNAISGTPSVAPEGLSWPCWCGSLKKPIRNHF